MDDLSLKIGDQFDWAVNVIEALHQKFEREGQLNSAGAALAFLYRAAKTDPLGEKIEQSIQLAPISIATDELRLRFLIALRKRCFEDGMDQVLLVGQGWQLPEEEQFKNGTAVSEDDIPIGSRDVIWATFETPQGFFKSTAPVIYLPENKKTFDIDKLLEVEYESLDDQPTNIFKILPCNLNEEDFLKTDAE